MSATPLLTVEGLTVNYGHIEAVQGHRLRAARRRRSRTLVGANGAGKSTTLLALSGLVRKAAGQVRFDGHDITRAGAAPHRRAPAWCRWPRAARR